MIKAICNIPKCNNIYRMHFPFVMMQIAFTKYYHYFEVSVFSVKRMDGTEVEKHMI